MEGEEEERRRGGEEERRRGGELAPKNRRSLKGGKMWERKNI